MNTPIARALIALCLAAPLSSFAQFALPALPGMGKSTASAAGDLSGQQDSLVRSFVGANKDVLRANAKMAEALGLKDKASEAQLRAEQLGEGATKGNLEDADKAVSDSSGAIAAAMAQKPVLDAQAKATFSAGLVSLASGVTRYLGLGKGVSDMSSSLSGASPMALPKLQSAAYVVGRFPNSAADLGKALKNAVGFARTNDIALPAGVVDATNAI